MKKMKTTPEFSQIEMATPSSLANKPLALCSRRNLTGLASSLFSQVKQPNIGFRRYEGKVDDSIIE